MMTTRPCHLSSAALRSDPRNHTAYVLEVVVSPHENFTTFDAKFLRFCYLPFTRIKELVGVMRQYLQIGYGGQVAVILC